MGVEGWECGWGVFRMGCLEFGGLGKKEGDEGVGDGLGKDNRFGGVGRVRGVGERGRFGREG